MNAPYLNSLALSAGLAISLQKSLNQVQAHAASTDPGFAATLQRMHQDLATLQATVTASGVSHPFFQSSQTPVSPIVPILENLIQAIHHQTGNSLHVAALHLKDEPSPKAQEARQAIQRTAAFLQVLSSILTVEEETLPFEGTLFDRAMALMNWKHEETQIDSSETAATSSERKIREPVLFVDDEPDVPELFAMILNEEGFVDVRTATDGASALAVFEENPNIAALVTDYMMPLMNGVELAREVWKRKPDLPVLFISGNVGKVRESLSPEEMQKSSLLSKPVADTHEISVRLRHLMRHPLSSGPSK